MERCDDCGFEYDLAQAPVAAAAIVAGTTELVTALGRNRVDPRTRRRPHEWSPLEYACHLRDVLLVQRERVLAARRMDCPTIDPMGREERVEHDGYSAQDPGDVVRQLADAALMFTNDLARLSPNDWQRTLVYNYPAPSERSLEWVAVHTVHEVQHHLLDVQRQLD